MRVIVSVAAAAALFSGCAQAFAPVPTSAGLRPSAPRATARGSVALRMGDSMDDIMARLAAMESGQPVPPPAPAPAYQPPAAAAPPPAYQPPAAAAPPPAAAPSAAAPPAAGGGNFGPNGEPKKAKKADVFAGKSNGPTEADMQAIYNARYSPEIEAQRAEKIQFYVGLGLSQPEAEKTVAKILGYETLKELNKNYMPEYEIA